MMKNKGIIPINKPESWTSFDVVNKLKYKLKPLKVGHLGTLDPMATGVLLVTVGKATKLFDLMQEKKKTYVVSFEFGYSTDTLDSTGVVESRTDKIPTLGEIQSVIQNFIGKISQIPPKYSAKSVNGQRAYDLARKGVEFELKPKIVEVFNIDILSYEKNILKLSIVCGSGTYIRSIGRDIAKEVDSLATMTSLVRTKVGDVDIKKCVNIEQIEPIEEKILPIKDFLPYEKLQLKKDEQLKLLNGQIIHVGLVDGVYSMEDEEDVVALIKICENKAKMFIFLG